MRETENNPSHFKSTCFLSSTLGDVFIFSSSLTYWKFHIELVTVMLLLQVSTEYPACHRCGLHCSRHYMRTEQNRQCLPQRSSSVISDISSRQHPNIWGIRPLTSCVCWWGGVVPRHIRASLWLCAAPGECGLRWWVVPCSSAALLQPLPGGTEKTDPSDALKTLIMTPANLPQGTCT